MRLTRATTIGLMMILGLGLCLAIGMQAAATRAAAAPKPVTVAMVDLEEVFKQLAERAAADARLNAMGQATFAERDKRQQELRKMEQDMVNSFSPDTPQYRAAEDDLVRKALEFEAWGKFKEREVDREKSLVMEDLYKKIKVAIAELASQQGYDIVMLDDSRKQLQRGSETAVLQQISLRRILHANPTLDITEELITRMNNAYKASAG